MSTITSDRHKTVKEKGQDHKASAAIRPIMDRWTNLASHTDPELCVSSPPPLLLSAGLKPQTIPSGNKPINSQQQSVCLSHTFCSSLDLFSLSHLTCFISACVVTNVLESLCVTTTTFNGSHYQKHPQ